MGIGFYLDCYECHSNRPGCGKEIDWILSRWKRCDMPAPKCVKIIERLEGNSLTLFDVILIHFKLKLLSQRSNILCEGLSQGDRGDPRGHTHSERQRLLDGGRRVRRLGTKHICALRQNPILLLRWTRRLQQGAHQPSRLDTHYHNVNSD